MTEGLRRRFGGGSAVALRYYVYISDAKVGMMLEQVDPAFARKRSSEVGLSLKVVSAKRKVETPASERVARLERVVRDLDDHYDVGTVDEPGQYFRGRMKLRWGPVGDASVVFFSGATENTVLGLGGATGHVLGTKGQPEQNVVFAPSSMPGLLAGLDAVLAESGELPPNALGSVHMANRTVRGAEQELEFVAKRLAHGPSPYPELDPKPGMKVLLGSPIFVALAE
ncbi:DUF7019 family protein [Lentzea sp. NPDC051213]|uniref:DUF7019 family protein n=1 Tax=Lentzea sp. NPDC051213 TaxID=3364126 RepID=UPI00378930A3